MKKSLIILLMIFAAAFCFAKDENYFVEKFELMDQQGDYDSIIAEINQKEEASYTVSDYYYLGLAYFRKENDYEANKYLKIAIQKAPDFPKAYYYLAGTFYYMNNPSEAITYFKKAIELDSTLTGPYQILGNIYESQHDYKTALDYYSKFYELEKSPSAVYQMAYVYYELNDFENAKPYVEEYLTYDKNSYSMTNLMILILYSIGDYTEAVNYENQIREIWKNTEDESIKNQNYFFIYSFDYNGYNVDVYERFDLSGKFYYPLTCNISKNGKSLKTINLEYDAITEEFGTPYFLGIDELEQRRHITLNVAFQEFPEFSDFILCVKYALDGKLEESASSYINK